MQNKVYIIGIGGIGISAIARYYLHIGYEVFGSDMCDSELIGELKKEGCKIIIGTSPHPSPLEEREFNLVIYTEAVPQNNPELVKAKELNIKIQTYPESLAEIVNDKKLVAISGTHGKSTTTSLTSLVLKNSPENVNAVIGTILKEFGNKNAYFSDSEYFIIEACEYKRSFLKYKPTVAVIINIEIDHLDYYKDLEDYISAYKEFLDNVKPGGFAILNGEDENCKKLLNLREDINYIEIYSEYYTHPQPLPCKEGGKEKIHFPEINMKVPGEHILFDTKIAYVIGKMVGIEENKVIKSLEDYTGVWRRMEIIGKTQNNNTLMSDYGHHPTEIKLTLKALKNQQGGFSPLLTIFQPHQYNRTLELLEEFKNCFGDTDKLIVPNIYESRDSEEDKKKINSKKFVELINHPDKIDGENFKNTLKLIENWEQKNKNGIIILMGAGNIDDLRKKIKTN
ncbi:MAG: UDP-N-acetylmuramate--L-alanine ligase [Candidatus Gracilibacteria bacterium]|nr:UDP-N-acetylmuramate--L-alanine ligase [Candidatus Gracilibacteria bacterium]